MESRNCLLIVHTINKQKCKSYFISSISARGRNATLMYLLRCIFLSLPSLLKEMQPTIQGLWCRHVGRYFTLTETPRSFPKGQNLPRFRHYQRAIVASTGSH